MLQLVVVCGRVYVGLKAFGSVPGIAKCESWQSFCYGYSYDFVQFTLILQSNADMELISNS